MVELVTTLEGRSCTPYRGGVPPLSAGEVESLLPEAAGWEAIDAHTKLEGKFSFKNFRKTLDFVIAVGELAEAEFHHPLSVHFGWGFATIVLQTKKIKGLHENDLIMAAKIGQIAERFAD